MDLKQIQKQASLSLPAIAFFLLAITHSLTAGAQDPDKIYKPYIATAQLFQYGNQLEMPIYKLNSGDKFELEFDDLEGNYKNYYYTYMLCDYNWQPVNLSSFDYIKGFPQNRITTYRYSSLAYTKYTHYQVIMPEQNSVPNRSGNYIVKVFLDGDTSKLVFTKRLLVLEQKAAVAATIVRPTSPEYFNTYQKVRFAVSTENLNAFSPAQQIKAVVLQNQRWDVAQRDIAPTFVRGNMLDYSNDQIALFPAGKEWRWLDLRSFSLQSDRIDHGDYGKTYTNLYVKTDQSRAPQRYVYYPDYDGMYSMVTLNGFNPFWQGDYATVKFTFAPPDGKRFDQDIYVAGQFTNYDLTDKYKMRWNDATNTYEKEIFMKQGYYSYTYLLAQDGNLDKKNPLEGNYWETENNYTILIYYKGFADRSDQLIGIGQVNSRNDRSGVVF